MSKRLAQVNHAPLKLPVVRRSLLRHLEEFELNGVTYVKGGVVQIEGVAGDFKIRRIDVCTTGIEIEVFGGARPAIRQFRAERVIPPAGTRAAISRRLRTTTSDPLREAIVKGKVKLDFDPDDPLSRKRTVNKLFSRAYSVGLKGSFRVRVSGHTAIGWRTDIDLKTGEQKPGHTPRSRE